MCQPEACGGWDGECSGGEVYSECGWVDGNCISMSKEDKGCAEYDNDDMGCEDGYNNYYDCSYNSSNDTCEARSPYNHKCYEILDENTCENEEHGEYCGWDGWNCRNKSSGSGSSQEPEYSCKKESEIKEIGLRPGDLCEDDDNYVSLGNYRCSDIQDTEESRDYYCNFDSLEKRNDINNYDKSGKRIDDACPLSCKVKGCITDCSEIVSRDLCNSTNINGVQCEYLEPGCEKTCSEYIEEENCVDEADSCGPYYDYWIPTADPARDKCPQRWVYVSGQGWIRLFVPEQGVITLENGYSCRKDGVPSGSAADINKYSDTGKLVKPHIYQYGGESQCPQTGHNGSKEFYWDLCYEQRTEGVCRASE